MFIKKIITLAVSIFIFNASAAELTYYYSMKTSDVSLVKDQNNEVPSIPKNYQYIDRFDMNSSGSGYYSGGGTSVKLSGSGALSKVSHVVDNDGIIEEVRVKWNHDSTNYATALRFVDMNTSNWFIQWFNNNNTISTLTDLNNQNSYINIAVTQYNAPSDVLEMRLNFKDNSYEFYTNDNLSSSGILFVDIPSSVAIQVFEASNTTTRVYLLSE